MHVGRSKRALLAAGLLISACIAGACATAPRRTAAERALDAGIAAQIEAALFSDPTIYARHIDVTVDRGVAYLGGFVWSDEDFRAARRDAASIAGVKSVRTQMDLVRGGISGSR